MNNIKTLVENKEELELILSTLENLPETNRVLREIDGNLIPHTVGQTKPAVKKQLQVVNEAIQHAKNQK